MVKWAILVIGPAQQPALSNYFERHGLPYIVAPAATDPFQAHTAFPGYDFLLCWAGHVIPMERLTESILPALDFSKINVTWDSYGRNFPHKTLRRWSRDLIGLPAAHRITDALLETQDVHILPKDLNVSDGYYESAKALLRNAPCKPVSAPYLVKRYNPASGRYE